MKMKKIVLALIVALMGTIVTNAQPPRHQEMSLEQMVQMRVDRMDRQLNLTEDQKTEIARIYTEEMTAMKQEREARMADGQ
jgi:Spy/CpxP family protein refolding chaperone